LTFTTQYKQNPFNKNDSRLLLQKMQANFIDFLFAGILLKEKPIWYTNCKNDFRGK